MKSAINVCGVSRSMKFIPAAALFIGASALPVHAVNPQQAIATAKVGWAVSDSTPDWQLGMVGHSDDGGNYNLGYVNNPWGINCTVTDKTTPKARSGTSTFIQHFTWFGGPRPLTQLGYSRDLYPTAYYAITGQAAHGRVASITEGDAVDATAVAADTPSSPGSETLLVKNPTTTDYTESVKTSGEVSTP